jgi:hypothetical protein
MPTIVILATADTALADLWEKQVSVGRIAVRLERDGVAVSPSPGLAAVVVLDAASEAALPQSFVRCPTIYVGEPRSLPFEQARMANRAKIFLSYDESAVRLRELLPLVEEVAEKQSMVEMLSNKSRRIEASRGAPRSGVTDTAEFWDFLEGAVENLDARDRLLGEFRRASRQVLHASHAVFFLREADGFRADRGTSFFGADDPMVAFFERHPAVIDGANWEGPSDPVGELAVRNRIALWGARLLIPIHDNGRLLGLIALGVRDDGQVYDESDKNRAVSFARLLRHFLGKCAHFSRLDHVATQVALGTKYLPGTLVLGPDENAPRHIPLVVREAIGQARRTHETARVQPSSGQPFRVSAGIIAETRGVWAYWQEASSEVHEALVRERKSRHAMLRELALTLNHELGNALVSLTTFRQATGERPMPPSLMQTVKGDVQQLEALNTNLALMQSIHDAEADRLDVREIAQAVCESLGVRFESAADPVVLITNKQLFEFTLRSLISTVAENRPDLGTNELSLRVRSTGSEGDVTALISLKGRNLQLEGILPEPSDDEVPNQGRMTVFLAKEILRLHHGEIHAGAGIEGTEILISLRSW